MAAIISRFSIFEGVVTAKPVVFSVLILLVKRSKAALKRNKDYLSVTLRFYAIRSHQAIRVATYGFCRTFRFVSARSMGAF